MFVPLSFHIIFLLLILLSPFFFQWSAAYLTTKNLILLGSVVTLAVIGNYAFFYGLENESVNEAEPVMITQAIFSMVLAAIFFVNERNPIILGLASVAVFSLLISRVKKHHLNFDKFSLVLLGGSFCFAVQTLLVKMLLEVYNPFTLYFFRAGFVGLILLMFIKFESKNVNQNKIGWMVINSAVVVTEFIAMYWSFQHFGVVFTTLIMTSAPLLVLRGSNIFLKEEVEFRNVAATVVIVGCIVGSLLI